MACRVFVCGMIYNYQLQGKGNEMINKMEWYYFTVPDDYTGLDVRFRYLDEGIGYCYAIDFRELYKQLAYI